MKPLTRATKNTPLDSNQLLSLCYRIRELMDCLDNNIRMVQLRLVTLSYLSSERTTDSALASLRCYDDLIELCNLSQLFVQLLDELHLKLGECSTTNLTIDYHIGSQQLAFFTAEWYDNLTPKLNETLAAASRHGVHNRMRPARVGKDEGQSGAGLEEALMRLRQSMRENERLVSIIANNIDYTKTTIESIYESLRASRAGLEASEQSGSRAIRILRESNRCKLACYFLVVVLIALPVTYALLSLLRSN